MRKLLAITCCALFACAIVISLSLPRPDQPAAQNKPNTQPTIEPPSAPSNSLTYVVREFNGNIAVFEKGMQKPFQITHIEVTSLPELDQVILKEGIEAINQNELTSILEDYCS